MHYTNKPGGDPQGFLNTLSRAALALAMTWGCSSSFTVDGGADAETPADTSVPSDTAILGEDTDPGSPDTGVIDPPEGDFEGFVTVHQTPQSDGGAITDLLAVFFAKDPGDVVIEREPVGSCELTRTIGRPPPGFVVLEDANIGPIVIQAPDAMAELRKGSLGYSPLRLDEALFGDAERVTVVGAGRGRFSPLRAELEAPSLAEVTEPALPATGRLPVAGDEDLPLVWTGGASGELAVSFIFESRARPDDIESIRCRYPVDAGVGVVPAAGVPTDPERRGEPRRGDGGRRDRVGGEHPHRRLARTDPRRAVHRPHLAHPVRHRSPPGLSWY